jgi:hypothetical protein
MELTKILDRPIAYHRVFVDLTGSVKAAIMLSQAVYWQSRARQTDGWWYKNADEWQEETGLTRHEQEAARKELSKYLHCELRGVPATLYWYVDEAAIMQDLEDKSSLSERVKPDSLEPQNQIHSNSETRFTQTVKLDSLKPRNIKDTETTQRLSETTSETTTGGENLFENQNRIQRTKESQRQETLNALQAGIKAHENIEFDSGKFPEDVRPYVDAFVKAMKWRRPLNKGEFAFWITVFRTQINMGIAPDDIRRAVKNMLISGLTISNPGSVTTIANNIHVKDAYGHQLDPGEDHATEVH